LRRRGAGFARGRAADGPRVPRGPRRRELRSVPASRSQRPRGAGVHRRSGARVFGVAVRRHADQRGEVLRAGVRADARARGPRRAVSAHRRQRRSPGRGGNPRNAQAPDGRGGGGDRGEAAAGRGAAHAARRAHNERRGDNADRRAVGGNGAAQAARTEVRCGACGERVRCGPAAAGVAGLRHRDGPHERRDAVRRQGDAVGARRRRGNRARRAARAVVGVEGFRRAVRGGVPAVQRRLLPDRPAAVLAGGSGVPQPEDRPRVALRAV
jgi:hypothetical protein